MTYRIVKPTIDERFINEIPRFFGGWLPTLREIFQNAYRAGATEVVVTSDPTQTVLTITDNGRGCPEFEALMCIGRSDWDGTKVVEAAGMGFISVLNGKIIERVTVRSANWRAEWKCQPQDLANAEVFDADPTAGFSLTLTLKDRHEDLVDDIRRARAFYPFTVTFNDQVIAAATIPYAIMLNTPVGRVYWREGSHSDGSSRTAIWEYRDLKSNALADAIDEAFRKMPFHLKNLFSGNYPQWTWFIDPACGVTPKLPDRNDLQADAHLAGAAHIIAQAFCDHALALVQTYAATLPDTLAAADLKGVAPYITKTDVKNILIHCLGWQQILVDDYTSYQVQWQQCDDGPGTYPELEYGNDYDVFVRPDKGLAIRMSDVETITNWMLLNDRTPCLRLVEDEAAVKERAAVIKIVGQKCKPGSLVAVAKSITWNGEKLPFYLNPAGGLQSGDEPLLILTGTAAEMMNLYGEHDELFRGWLLSVAGDEGYLADWCEEEYDEWSADLDRIDDTLQADILKYGTKALQQAQQREAAARKNLRALNQCKQALRDLNDDATADSSVKVVWTKINAAIKKISAEQKRLAKLIEQQTATA